MKRFRITPSALSCESVFERLQRRGFEYEEIDEAILRFLLDDEEKFLNSLYPFGLDVSSTKYEFALLNQPVTHYFNHDYWELAQKILDAFGSELQKYHIDAAGEVMSIDGSPIPERQKYKLQALLHLQQLYLSTEKYIQHYSVEFDYIKTQSLMGDDMRRILGDTILSSIPATEFIAADKKNSTRRFIRILSILEYMILDCRKGRTVFRYDLKRRDKYLKLYNPEPFARANKRAHQRALQDSIIKNYLDLQKSFSISAHDLPLFRQSITDLAFMSYLRKQSDQQQRDEGLDSYSLVRIWIDPSDIKNFSSIASKGLHLETISGTVKESITKVLTQYQSGYLYKIVGVYKAHRPETLRYLARKAPNVPYNTIGQNRSCKSIDKLFILLNVMNMINFSHLPLLEQRFIILKFGLKGDFYSCPVIATMLNVDLNLIKNFYAKYLKLIFKAMEQYAHQYIDMEAEQKVVLK